MTFAREARNLLAAAEDGLPEDWEAVAARDFGGGTARTPGAVLVMATALAIERRFARDASAREVTRILVAALDACPPAARLVSPRLAQAIVRMVLAGPASPLGPHVEAVATLGSYTGLLLALVRESRLSEADLDGMFAEAEQVAALVDSAPVSPRQLLRRMTEN